MISVNTGDTDAECIAFDETYGIEFPCISGVEGGGSAINSTYGIPAYPTYILIAPNHDIVEQDMWTIYSTQTFIDYIDPYGLEETSCSGVSANFSSDITEICGNGTVNFSNNSIGEITSWDWTFEGGYPATSTDENPIVAYTTEGEFDVTLTVNGIDGDTYSVENYISVFEIPDVSHEVFPNACIFWEPYELTGGTPEGGTYSGLGITDNMFDPDVAGLGTHTITYTYTSDDGCENYVEEDIFVDVCAGIDEYKNNVIKVYPNPSTDIVNISSRSNITSVSIYNYTGQLMVTSKLDDNAFQFNAENYTAGVYTIMIETEDGITSKRLIIR